MKPSVFNSALPKYQYDSPILRQITVAHINFQFEIDVMYK